MSQMNSIVKNKTPKFHGLMQGMEGLGPFPLICVYKSPSKTHQLTCHSAGSEVGAEEDVPRLAAAAEKAQ